MITAKDMWSTELEELVEDIVEVMQQYDDPEDRSRIIEKMLISRRLLEE